MTDAVVDRESSPTIDLYWRPGCGACHVLRLALAGTGMPVREINIWDDDEAAARLRSVARGNESVPTVFLGDDVLVQPNFLQVMTLVSAAAPELLPEEFKANPDADA